tara:strand:- start:789 stop:1094 length:306 start_codon:yes stop_codon:yes gene_type:complete
MKKLKELLKETNLWKNRKFGDPLPTVQDYKNAYNKKYNVNEAGISKSYKAIMELEKEILNFEKIFKKEKGGMVKDRANNMQKSLDGLKECWTSLYTDTQER